MAVLVLGGYGFIGSEIMRALNVRGIEAIGAGRDLAFARRILPANEWRRVDLGSMTDPASWRPLLAGVDRVVNASGLLQDGDGGKVTTVQRDSIEALIAACEQSGINRFVQISAAGAEAAGSSLFMTSKAEADAALSRSRLGHVILRPGLVIGRNSYGGTELLRALAALPWLRPRFAPGATIQTVAMDDVVEAVMIALETAQARPGPVDLVHQKAHSLDGLVERHRRWLGLPDARMSVRVPKLAIRAACAIGDLLGRLGWRPAFRSNAWSALAAGVSGDSSRTRAWLGREPRSLGDTLDHNRAGKPDRLAARLILLLPLLMASLFAMWMASALATLADIPRATTLLEPAGLPRGLAQSIIVGGTVIDGVLAVALLYRPLARAALFGMVVVTLFYLVAASVLLPGLWADPLAPLAKTLPAAVAALVAALIIERR